MKIYQLPICWPGEIGNQPEFDGRIQAGVTLLMMAKILMQGGKPEEALPHIQEAVTKPAAAICRRRRPRWKNDKDDT